ncbi:MAG: RluA family pseudouridine synthase [Opitutales bacterium]|nr:RluA family pseudouridine synthase [Opitutales bacterium]NRA27561.1 RluA family pseudouridine synthase [Opitutales bacterium]
MPKDSILDPRWFETEAPLVDPEELNTWILHEDDNLLVINKPGWLVCHPSKKGPWSSLAGAVREQWQMDQVHMVARLDRETSGLVIFAKHPKAARRYQMAMSQRRVEKTYFALLAGRMSLELNDRLTVDIPLVRDRKSLVHVKVKAQKGQQGQRATTYFMPRAYGERSTWVEIGLETGRKHQIRAHAEWMGHSVIGDKIYGPDANWFLEFIDSGWTPEMAAALIHPRQALHCARMHFLFEDGEERDFEAPLTEDLVELLKREGIA